MQPALNQPRPSSPTGLDALGAVGGAENGGISSRMSLLSVSNSDETPGTPEAEKIRKEKMPKGEGIILILGKSSLPTVESGAKIFMAAMQEQLARVASGKPLREVYFVDPLAKEECDDFSLSLGEKLVDPRDKFTAALIKAAKNQVTKMAPLTGFENITKCYIPGSGNEGSRFLKSVDSNLNPDDIVTALDEAGVLRKRKDIRFTSAHSADKRCPVDLTEEGIKESMKLTWRELFSSELRPQSLAERVSEELKKQGKLEFIVAGYRGVDLKNAHQNPPFSHHQRSANGELPNMKRRSEVRLKWTDGIDQNERSSV